MNNDDQKKYNILQNIMQKLNQKYIALPENETKRNNKLLVVIDRIVQKIRSKSPLFDNLYQNKYYGGSYYDNLKISQPSEYDLDCVLCLPKIAEPTVEVSDKPGYVHVVLNMQALEKKVDEAPKYIGLEKLLKGNRLCAKKVKSWMEGLMALILPTTLVVKIDDSEYSVKDTFFVVPKSPSDTDTVYWRLSFQEQERELISGYAVMKPTIRLIKKIRDRYQHKIASYFIKTVFLWELENVDKNLWNKTLSYVFMTSLQNRTTDMHLQMLRKYAQYIAHKNIPYYWNKDYNLIGDLSETTTNCIANKLKNIADEVDRNYQNSPYDIVQYFCMDSCLLQKSTLKLSSKKFRWLKDLREELEVKRADEARDRNELMKVISMVNKKVDDLVKKTEPSKDDFLDLLLDSNETLTRTSNFQSQQNL
ncbi:uncharacterized protein BDFB_007424, partial [Asbolus verrucosus]